MKHLTKDELRKFLTVAKSHSERDWLIALVLYRHGLRISEVVGHEGVERKVKGKTRMIFPLRGVDIRDGQIVVQRLKGSKKTEQPLGYSDDPLFDEKTPLEELARHNPGILFPITRQAAWKFFQRYGLEAGIWKSKAHPHIQKHSIAMHGIKQAGIENMRQFLGHESMASTGRYLVVDDDVAAKTVAAAVGL